MYLPYKTDLELEEQPTGTLALICLNTLIFLYIILMSRGEVHQFVSDWGFTWFLFHPTTLVTSQFIHAGVGHLVGNMLFLWLYGPGVEDQMGSVKMVLFFIGGGIIATFVHGLTIPELMMDQPLIGASGAVSAMLGAFVVFQPRKNVHHIFWYVINYVTFSLPAWIVIGYWFALQVLKGHLAPVSSVAYFAHIGGFLVGFLGAVVYRFEGDFIQAISQMRTRDSIEEVQEIDQYLEEGSTLSVLRDVLDDHPRNTGLNFWVAVKALEEGEEQYAKERLRILDQTDINNRELLADNYLLQRYFDLDKIPEETPRIVELLCETNNYELAEEMLNRYLENNRGILNYGQLRFRQAEILADELEEIEKAQKYLSELLRETATEDLKDKITDKLDQIRTK